MSDDSELAPAPDPTTHVMVCPLCKAWQVDAHPRARAHTHLGGRGPLWAAVAGAHLEHVKREHRVEYLKHAGGRLELQVAQVRLPRWWVWR